MYPALPAVIAEVVERSAGPCLVFDLARIDANLAAIAGAAGAAGVTALFAAKSFPHPAVRGLAAARLAGFDVASPAELADAAACCGAAAGLRAREAVLSVADPSGRSIAAAERWRGRLIVSCDTPEQVTGAPPGAEIAIRLSASLTGSDPAVGAVLDGTGHRRSRFGVDVDPERQRSAIAELARAAQPRPVGLHIHHGAVAATSAARFVATARAALDAARGAGIAPRFVNLGGAWHAVADLAGALAELRAALPGLEILIEPGRRIADGAGFACGRLAQVRALDDRVLCVGELSRSCHLRWSQPELVAPPPRPGAGRPVVFAGPTCYEDDVLGEWTVEPARFTPGALAVFRHITGYAVAWNTGFGGVAPAEVVLV